MTLSLFPEMDLSNTKPETGRAEPIPAGLYECLFTAPEVKVNEETGVVRLSYTLQVTSGEYEGRKIFDSIMLAHPQYPDMVARHQGILRALLDAVGGPTRIPDEHTLIDAVSDKVVMAKVYIRKDKSGQYGDRNSVTTFLGGGVANEAPAPARPAPRAAAPAAAAPAAARPAPGAAMPWRK